MPKVLICASTILHINNFHLPYLKYFKEQGFEVHIAVPDSESTAFVDFLHTVPVAKRLLSVKNLDAVLQMRNIIKANRFDIILTHTTLAAFVTRLGVLLAGKGQAKVINTVHGYFFWNGCGPLKKIIYYLPELFLRGVTDCVITMNDEDALAARGLVRKNGFTFKVHGMGVDASRFVTATGEERLVARRELSVSEDAFVLVYAAEFSKRKNHIELIKAMPEIKKREPKALLVLCGSGALQSEIEAETDKLGLRDNVRFLGWCSRMEQIYKVCDLAVSTSRSEGLPFNLVEAQLCALPVVASRIREHIDLIEDGKNGWSYPSGDYRALAAAVIRVIKSPDLGQKQGKAASLSAKKYTLSEAYKENTDIYKKIHVGR